MNPAIAGAVFAIIFVGELPDKTMLAALVMSDAMYCCQVTQAVCR